MVSDVWQIAIHVAELFLPDPTSSPFEGEIGIANLKRYASPGSHRIPVELLQLYLPVILFGIGKNCLISGRSLLLYQFTKRAIKLTVSSIVGSRRPTFGLSGRYCTIFSQSLEYQ
jgi:hypothetical protein